MVNIRHISCLKVLYIEALNQLSFSFVVCHEMMHILIFEECLKSFVFEFRPGICLQLLWFSSPLEDFLKASINEELVFDFQGITHAYLQKISIQVSMSTKLACH